MKYGVVLADPPWSYRNAGVEGAAEAVYKTTDTDALCDLPVREIMKDDAVLVMWATWPCLTDAFQLIEAWGCEYVTGLPWIKTYESPFVDLFGAHVLGTPCFGTGFWIRGCTEPILICRRGSPRIPDTSMLGLISERFAHSRKPENIHHYCEQMDGPYLELFARRARAGWDVWGNEAPNGVQLFGCSND